MAKCHHLSIYTPNLARLLGVAGLSGKAAKQDRRRVGQVNTRATPINRPHWVAPCPMSRALTSQGYETYFLPFTSLALLFCCRIRHLAAVVTSQFYLRSVFSPKVAHDERICPACNWHLLRMSKDGVFVCHPLTQQRCVESLFCTMYFSSL